MGDRGTATVLGARPARMLGADFRRLGMLTQTKAAYNAAYLGAAWVLILGGMALFRWHPTWWTFAIGFAVVSARQQVLLNVEHECIHAQFVRSRIANDRVGVALCASPCGSPYWASRARHLAHHRRLATPDDPDAVLHTGVDKATGRGLARYFGLGLLGGYALRAVTAKMDTVVIDPSWRRRDRRNLVVAQVILAVGFTLAFGWWAYPLLWLAPLMTVTVALHALRSFGEHALLPGEEVTHANRLITTTSNPLERFFMAPYNMNYHSEHHLFPWVLATNLPEVRRRLGDQPAVPARLTRRSYLGTLVRSVRQLP